MSEAPEVVMKGKGGSRKRLQVKDDVSSQDLTVPAKVPQRGYSSKDTCLFFPLRRY
jgi:hypothetical protein